MVYSRLYGIRNPKERVAGLAKDLDIDGLLDRPLANCPPDRKPAFHWRNRC